MNTDFIDNSAGVDTSDHEVNLKILLDRVVKAGDLTREAAQQPAGRDDRRGRRPGARATTTSRTSRSPTPPRTRRRCCTCTRTGCAGWSRTASSTGSSRGCRRAGRSSGRARPRRGADRARARGAAGLDQDRARRGAARLRPARRPVPRPATCGRTSRPPVREGFEPQIQRAPAAPRDHRDPGRQRPGQRRRHDVLAAAVGGDRRHRRRADPGQLRGPRDLRLAADAHAT